MPSACRVRSTRSAISPRLATSTRANTSGSERSGDHHLLDLVRALADREDLGVAVETADRVLLDVAVAAVDLHRLLAAAHRQPPRLELRLRGGEREAAAGVLEQRRLVGEQAGGAARDARRPDPPRLPQQ